MHHLAGAPSEVPAREVQLDRDGAVELQKRGVDTGLDAKEGVRTIGEWRLYKNAKGEKFAVCGKGWYDIDCTEATPTPVPIREIWRFFTGEDIPVCLEGVKGVHLIAKRRPDGRLAVLVNNMRGGAVGPFTAIVSGKPRMMALAAYAAEYFKADEGEAR